MLGAVAGGTARYNLAALGDETAERAHVFVIDLEGLVRAEAADLAPPARTAATHPAAATLATAALSAIVAAAGTRSAVASAAAFTRPVAASFRSFLVSHLDFLKISTCESLCLDCLFQFHRRGDDFERSLRSRHLQAGFQRSHSADDLDLPPSLQEPFCSRCRFARHHDPESQFLARRATIDRETEDGRACGRDADFGLAEQPAFELNPVPCHLRARRFLRPPLPLFLRAHLALLRPRMPAPRATPSGRPHALPAPPWPLRYGGCAPRVPRAPLRRRHYRRPAPTGSAGRYRRCANCARPRSSRGRAKRNRGARRSRGARP